MKRLCLLLLIIPCLVLTACGTGSFSSKRQQLSERLDAVETLNFTASIRAEYTEKTARFTLSYYEDSDGGSVEVVSPSLIAGVTANILPDGTSLEYNGVCLATGALDEYGLSPMSSLPLLVQALKSGSMNSAWAEGDCLVMELQSTDNLSCTVWFEPATMEPQSAELVSDGRVRVFMEFSDWQESL